MDARDGEQVFDTYLFIEQDMKAPGTQDVATCVKNETRDNVDRIDVFEAYYDIPWINLGRKKKEQNNRYENRKYFCQKFRNHDP